MKYPKPMNCTPKRGKKDFKLPQEDCINLAVVKYTSACTQEYYRARKINGKSKLTMNTSLFLIRLRILSSIIYAMVQVSLCKLIQPKKQSGKSGF